MEKFTEENLEKLLAELDAFKVPPLSDEQKISMKARLLDRIDEPVLSPVIKATLKERVFAMIDDVEQKSHVFYRVFGWHKKFVSAMLLFVMSFGVVNFYSGATNVVLADTFTQVNSFEGEVVIQRGARNLPVRAGMKLEENDKVITGEESFVNITFLDDSAGRLAPNSEINVSRLTGDTVQSSVEVDLVDGVFWSRVVNLVEENSSFSVKAGDVYVHTKRAAFNVEKINGEVEVEVFNDTVNVRDEDESENVVKGKKVVVDDSKRIALGDLGDALNDDWVKKNLEDDKQHILEVEKRLLIAKAKSVGLDTDSANFSLEDSFTDKARLFLTFDDVEKKKKELALAEKRFVAAQVRLESGSLSEIDRIEAEQVMKTFRQEVEGFYDLVDEVSATDKVFAAELEGYVEQRLLTHKKALSVTLPGSPSYEAKEIVKDLEILNAEKKGKGEDVRREVALTKISEAEEVKARGDQDLADAVIVQAEEILEGVSEYSEVTELLATVKKQPEVVVEEEEVLIAEPVASASSSASAGSVAGVATVVVSEEEEEPAAEEPAVEEPVVEEKDPEDFGVKIEGDKALPPLLQ